MNIGFYRSAFIGDIIVSLHAVYMIKVMYPNAQLILYTNSHGESLFSSFNFIDTVINMDNMNKEDIIRNMNAYHFNYFIMTQPNRWRCQIVGRTNAKKIISFLDSGSWFRWNFTNILSSRVCKISQYQSILRLVKKINPDRYDDCMQTIDFSPIIFQTKLHHQEVIAKYLESIQANKYTKKIIINPFSRTTTHNLSMNSWTKLGHLLSKKYPNSCFIIPSFPEAQEISYEQTDNIFIFHNDSDLFHLIELIKNVDLVITPSTAVIHFANNVHTPAIGLYQKKDMYLWAGDNIDKDLLIVLQKPKTKMNTQDEDRVIRQICEKIAMFFEQ